MLVFLTLYAQDGLGIENPGLFFTFAAGTMLLTRLLIGKVIDRHGIAVVVVPAFLLGIGLYLLLAFAAGSTGAAYALFLACGAIYGVVTAIFYPAVQSVAVVDAPPERKGVANSTMFFGQDLGILVASAVLGWVVEEWGYVAMFLCGIALFGVSILLTLLLMRNRTRAARRAKYGVA